MSIKPCEVDKYLRTGNNVDHKNVKFFVTLKTNGLAYPINAPQSLDDAYITEAYLWAGKNPSDLYVVEKSNVASLDDDPQLEESDDDFAASSDENDSIEQNPSYKGSLNPYDRSGGDKKPAGDESVWKYRTDLPSTVYSSRPISTYPKITRSRKPQPKIRYSESRNSETNVEGQENRLRLPYDLDVGDEGPSGPHIHHKEIETSPPRLEYASNTDETKNLDGVVNSGGLTTPPDELHSYNHDGVSDKSESPGIPSDGDEGKKPEALKAPSHDQAYIFKPLDSEDPTTGSHRPQSNPPPTSEHDKVGAGKLFEGLAKQSKPPLKSRGPATHGSGLKSVEPSLRNLDPILHHESKSKSNIKPNEKNQELMLAEVGRINSCKKNMSGMGRTGKIEYVYDYYEILGLTSSSTSNEIRTKYRNTALRVHPDKIVRGNLSLQEFNKAKDNATEAYKKLNDAYGELSDLEARSRFDTYVNRKGIKDNVQPDLAYHLPSLFGFGVQPTGAYAQPARSYAQTSWGYTPNGAYPQPTTSYNSYSYGGPQAGNQPPPLYNQQPSQSGRWYYTPPKMGERKPTVRPRGTK